MKKIMIIAIALMVLSIGAVAQAHDLTGIWSCNDGGTYYIRQVGEDIWWYGEKEHSSNHSGPQWANVAHGRISDNIIHLEWADVPRGEDRGAGRMILRIEESHRLERVERSGTPFGGTVWRREHDDRRF